MEKIIKIAKFPPREQWSVLMSRDRGDTQAVQNAVTDILAAVKHNGDNALISFAKIYDGVKIDSLRVSPQEIEEAEKSVSDELKDAIGIAAKNIHNFHLAQRMQDVSVDILPGINCQQRAVPIGKIGLYIPGGNSPLFSTVLMLAIPAHIAGCKQVVLCTPPNKQGKIHPAILYAASVAGVTEIYKSGGAQAIAGMAYGTETIPQVYKIFGPGNRFVMEAKQQVSLHGVAIDMPAGPSEVMVIADGAANREFVASDFLSQAEHGPDSQSILLTTDEALANEMPEELNRLLATLPRREMMLKSLSHSSIILLKSDAEIFEFANEYAPEHLIINCRNARDMANRVENAGSVFIGAYSPESAGDYASGTNHTLPTSGYAKAYSGVNLDSFIKKITFQELTKEGLRSIGNAVEILAENEDLLAHRLAVTVRLNELKKI